MRENVELRLSTQRALLGQVWPQVRLVKVSWRAGEIEFFSIVDPDAPEEAIDALSEAATEIIADFPEAKIHETIVRSAAALPVENVMEHGWVYARAQPG